jgi:hypothetical protein
MTARRFFCAARRRRSRYLGNFSALCGEYPVTEM